jgi:hypothetical protein
MSRTVAVLLVWVLVVGCRAPKTTSSDKFVSYTPTTVGDKWLIASDYGDGFRDDFTYEVTAVERRDGALVVTTERRPVTGTARFIEKAKVSDAGLFLMEEGEHRYDPPVLYLPMPVKEKDTWKSERPGIAKWTYTAGPEEEVEVPAGRFKALRIDGVGESEGKPVRCTLWKARGHPAVKTVLWLGDDKIVEVLKSFTPGKKE